MRGWPLIFVIAALFNAAVAIPAILAPQMVNEMIFGGTGSPIATQLIGWLVLVFGLGYLMVAMAPRKHVGIVAIGTIGKLGVFLLLFWHWMAGAIPSHTFLLGSGDLLWVILFATFLKKTRNKPRGLNS